MENHFFVPSRAQKIEQLSRMKDLLKYPKYEMAIIDDEKPENFDFKNLGPTFCEVQEGQIVLIEFRKDGDCSWYSAVDRVIVNSFKKSLSKLWNRINDEDNDKYNIMRRLESWIEELRQI